MIKDSNPNSANLFGLKSLDSLLENIGIRDIQKQSETNFLLRFQEPKDIDLIKSKLKENDHVEEVSYNYFRGFSS